MSSQALTLKDIITGQNDCGCTSVVIPKIQRDYAQGRSSAEAKRVRVRFLKALHEALGYGQKPGDKSKASGITLDFVYGNIDSKGVLTPLDGQQRLTTLFLLYWYVAKRAKLKHEDYDFLSAFSYETRYSSLKFCQELVAQESFKPCFNEDSNCLSEQIKDQSWYVYDWEHDPTIASMLTMLDAIHDEFGEEKHPDRLWKALIEDRAITFYFCSIEGMGLTDDLYIKMNSRGKALTTFENFKAELEREISRLSLVVDEDRIEAIEQIPLKIDTIWTDLLWKYCSSGIMIGEDKILGPVDLDNLFMGGFRYVCDILYFTKYKQGIAKNESAPDLRWLDDFELIKAYFCVDAKSPMTDVTDRINEVIENFEALASFFDCWSHLDSSPSAFLSSYLENEPPYKLDLEDDPKIYVWTDPDLFRTCLYAYGQRDSFSQKQTALMHAITTYLQHADDGEISVDEFKVRLRIINNLVQNSALSSENFDKALSTISSIMTDGVNSDWLKEGGAKGKQGSGFSAAQLREERAKLKFLRDNNSDKQLAQALYNLDNHWALYGQIGIILFEQESKKKGATKPVDVDKFMSRAECFHALFSNDEHFKLIDMALMTEGYYGKHENWWRSGLGRNQDSWQELFHMSDGKYSDATQKALIGLLDKLIEGGYANKESNEREASLTSLVEAYKTRCETKSEYPWEYYYLKYDQFRNDSGSGKLYIVADGWPYEKFVMKTSKNTSSTTFMPFLEAAKLGGALTCFPDDGDSVAKSLPFENVYIGCTKASFEVYGYDKKKPTHIGSIRVKQSKVDKYLIDTEDRVLLLNDFIDECFGEHWNDGTKKFKGDYDYVKAIKKYISRREKTMSKTR